MEMEVKPLFRQKTFWTGISGIVSAIAAYFLMETDLVVTIQAVIGFLGLIFLRKDQAKPTAQAIARAKRAAGIFIFIGAVAFSATAAQAETSVTFAWDPNSETDLGGYRFYYKYLGEACGDLANNTDTEGQPANNYTPFDGSLPGQASPVVVGVSPTPQITLADQPDGLWVAAVTAFNANGESRFSRTVTYCLNSTVPRGIDNLHIFDRSITVFIYPED